jgi:hypothetical protein
LQFKKRRRNEMKYTAKIHEVAADPRNPEVRRFEITVTDGDRNMRSVSSLVGHSVESAEDLQRTLRLLELAAIRQMLTDAGSAAVLESLTGAAGE